MTKKNHYSSSVIIHISRLEFSNCTVPVNILQSQAVNNWEAPVLLHALATQRAKSLHIFIFTNLDLLVFRLRSAQDERM